MNTIHNLNIVASWFGATITTLVLTLLLLIYLSTTKVVTPSSQDFRLYAALPKNTSSVSESIERIDGREKLIENFFKGYKSDLTEYAQSFVKVADDYHLDYRLLPSIAMQESNGGKRIVKNSYNPFGFGIYGSSVIRFSSWEEAIEKVGQSLREDYLDQGLMTPESIMAKYTPSSLAKGGAWAKGVTSFMEKLR